MSTNRGMSVSQAKALASDTNTSAGVLGRLANSYPECWPELLANPSVSHELKSWIQKAQAQEQSRAFDATATTSNPAVSSKPVKSTSSPAKKQKSRGRKRYGRFVRTIGMLIVPSMLLTGIYLGVQYLDSHRPPVGVINMQNLDGVDGALAWKYDLSSKSHSDCVQYQFGTVEQHKVAVLTQNDLSKKGCKDLKDVPSTLALVDLNTGVADWKIDLAAELDWTEKWKKQLVEVPGLDEVLIKYIDINGSDAGGNVVSVDKGDDRKMKTIVPYNRLNGRIPDPVIAKSNSQPIMQAPVLEVMAIPGNLKNVLVMTNGAKKDFRYAKYRSKRFSSPRWSTESDLRPVGGTQIIGDKLVLGRKKGDHPKAIKISSGKFVGWHGSAGSKVYQIGADAVEILGDGVAEKATNIESQGGIDGKDITINGIDNRGNTKWTLEARGYAIARNDSFTNPTNRNWFSNLLTLSGKHQQFVSLVNAHDGSQLWKTKISQERFEIARSTAGNRLAVYLYKKYKVDTKTFSLLDLTNGSESEPMQIAGKRVRVDGATDAFSILVDEPDREEIVKQAEKGKVASLTRKDKSDQTRACVQGVDNAAASITWSYECNGNIHAVRAGGIWLALDLTPGSENFWPLKKEK